MHNACLHHIIVCYNSLGTGHCCIIEAQALPARAAITAVLADPAGLAAAAVADVGEDEAPGLGAAAGRGVGSGLL